MRDHYSTNLASLPVVGHLVELITSVMGQRMTRFDVDRTSGITRNYFNSIDRNKMLNTLVNMPVTNDIV